MCPPFFLRAIVHPPGDLFGSTLNFQQHQHKSIDPACDPALHLVKFCTKQTLYHSSPPPNQATCLTLYPGVLQSLVITVNCTLLLCLVSLTLGAPLLLFAVVTPPPPPGNLFGSTPTASTRMLTLLCICRPLLPPNQATSLTRTLRCCKVS